MCASMADDTNGDGVVTNEEGSGEYGSVFLALTTTGDTSAKSGLALDRMPVADENGRLEYDRTIPADALPTGLVDRLSALHIVQHGIDVNDNQRYDLKALGESTFARGLGLKNVPEEATNPASCGVVTGAGAPTPPHGGVETGGGETAAQSVALWSGIGAVLLAASTAIWGWRRDRTPVTEK